MSHLVELTMYQISQLFHPIVGEGEVHESSRIAACPLTGRSGRF